MALSCCLAAAADPDARRLADQARKAERAGQVVQAYLLYSQASARDPQNLEYFNRAQALRVKAALIADKQLPQAGIIRSVPAAAQAAASPSAPSAAEASVPPEEPPPVRPAIREAQPPPELKPAPERRNLDFRGDAKSLFTQVAPLYRLEAIFDTDYPPSSPITFRLDDANWIDAIRALEAATSSFVVPIDEKRILVVKDTPQKRQEREPYVAVTVPVPDLVTPQDAQELANVVRQVMQISRVGFDPGRQTIVIRDRLSLAIPAQALVQELLRRRAVVLIEFELLEMDRSASRTYGASLQTLFPLLAFGSPLRSSPIIPAGFTQFLTFGGGNSLLGLGILGAQLVAQGTRSTGQLLFHTELRSLDGQPANIHVGDRYPIVTAKEILLTGTPSSYPPSFSYQDLGLVIKATPHVHGADEVTLDLEATFKALTAQVFDGIPVISNRALTSEVRLRSGEWAVAAGLMTSSDARTITGLAGFSRIPVVNKILSRNTRDQSESQVLLLIRPTLLTLTPAEVPTRPISTGPEMRPRIPL